MWGGSGDTPGYFLSKSGSLKKDNTPHQFKIGGIRMESYFSPSDHTTSAIERAIKTANKDFQFGLLTMTRNELGSAAVEMHKKGVGVRGIIENVGDQGTEYQFLLDNNVAVEQHDLPYIFHHKYGIIDATAPASDPIVVFGSHNWTTAAETVNDENTLIVHDANFANIYLQEFELRWCELTAPNNCLTSLGEKPSAGYANLKIYPNPATNYIQIENPAGLQHGKWVTRIFSQDGRMVKALFGTESDSPAHHQLAVSELPSGKYIIMLENGVTRFLGAFQKI
jgi:phosphatidylserine/phosphatidylglycerophosphate/cardiolipin synthase-like enzyme